MKLNRLETHDRLEYLTKQNFSIGECCQDLINKRPFGEHSFYIFAHARTDEDGVTKRMLWQPRLTKPKAQTNSMLFKGYPGSDNVKVIWIIPERHLWDNYRKGNLLANPTVVNSIHDFIHNRRKLEANEDDDLSDAQIDAIYTNISAGASSQRLKDKLYLGE